jgi:gas vesicle protein
MGTTTNHECGHLANGVGGFVAGLLMGSLVGAGAMLLLAPKSGKETRDKIRQEGQDLQRHVTDTVDDAMAQARGTKHKITDNVRLHVEQMEQRAQDILKG